MFSTQLTALLNPKLLYLEGVKYSLNAHVNMQQAVLLLLLSWIPESAYDCRIEHNNEIKCVCACVCSTIKAFM